MNEFVYKITFIKIYIYNFLINILIEIRSQTYVLETVLLPKTSCFMGMEGVVEWQRILKKLLHMIELIEIYRINRW